MDVVVGVGVDVVVGVGVGNGPQSVQSPLTLHAVPQSYSPNNPPIGEFTSITDPAWIQWFLLNPGKIFGDKVLPSQRVTV